MKIKCNINLIEDIKCPYNLERIISFVEPRQKLKIFIYNKQIQKMLGINIQDFITISNRYKIVEKNGKGREYAQNGNYLIFEGEYLHLKRNGKGKEYIIKMVY